MAELDHSRIRAAFSTRHWRFEYLEENSCPASVAAALKLGLPQIDPQSWPDREAFGGIYLNGQLARLDQPLSVPAQIEYYEPLFDFRAPDKFFSEFKPNFVVYQDDDIIIVHKPARLPTQPAREQKHFSLKHSVERYLGAPVHMPSRLDMSAQGLVLISRSVRTHPKLQRAYEQRAIDKYYLLAVSGEVEWQEKRVSTAIDKDPRHPVLRRTVSTGGKPAITDFKVLARRAGAEATGAPGVTTIIEAKPQTGRTHQIRVHTAALGLPIVGDNFYGGLAAPELHLLSARLGLVHPFSGARLEISLPQALAPDWAKEFLP